MKYRSRIVCIAAISVFAIILIMSATARSARTAGGAEHGSIYTIRLDGDEISIENAGGEITKTGIKAFRLPLSDIRALQTGIKVDSYEKVLELMEDYSS